MEPYRLLSRIYDEGWGTFWEGYLPFIEFLRRRRGLTAHRVLDLACGTGSLAVALAPEAARVRGLDACPQMVELAREKARSVPNVSFSVGDFRDFDLGETFDLVLCTFDSLNYVRSIEELSQVFGRVSAHLEPGGHFVFDVVTERHMLLCDGFSGSFELNGVRYRHASRYDRGRKENVVTFEFPDGGEVHRQIPIEYADILRALEGSGLLLKEAFSGPGGKPAEPDGRRFFVVLYKPKA